MGKGLVVVANGCKYCFGRSTDISIKCRIFGLFGYLCGCGVCVVVWLVWGIVHGILKCVVVIWGMIL